MISLKYYLPAVVTIITNKNLDAITCPFYVVNK